MAAPKREQCLKGEKELADHVKLREPLTVECVCPKCGKKVAHQRGVPCNTIVCPECGTHMTRAV